MRSKVEASHKEDKMDVSSIEITEELEKLTLPEIPSLEATIVEDKVNSVPAGEEPNLTDEEFQELTKEAAVVDAAISALNERKEELKKVARRLPYGTNERQGTSAKVQIGHNPVFEREEFEAAYPYDAYELEKVVEQDEDGNDVIRSRMKFPNRGLYKIEPNRPEIKRVLGKEESDKFYSEGTKKVTFK